VGVPVGRLLVSPCILNASCLRHEPLAVMLLVRIPSATAGGHRSVAICPARLRVPAFSGLGSLSLKAALSGAVQPSTSLPVSRGVLPACPQARPLFAHHILTAILLCTLAFGTFMPYLLHSLKYTNTIYRVCNKNEMRAEYFAQTFSSS
jgi:hypothetical protein